MGKRITYEIHGQVERNSFFRVGKALIRIEFTGGMVNSTGVYPAQYTTDNPLYQQAIENSQAFRCGEIRRGKVDNIATIANEQEAEPDETVAGDVFTEVSNLQQARTVLMGEPYCCSLSDLQNKAAVKAVAAQKGVSFPNWL
ncbi:MAG: hypothetical protein IKL54_06995 [Bacteroidaceae bacterium]|nr:hypothetical protein [Bacteroidaceae bacterium]MBR3613025.1 hypothetical protein [Bacteroidaceae bacterium]